MKGGQAKAPARLIAAAAGEGAPPLTAGKFCDILSQQLNKDLRCRRKAAEQGSGVQIPSGAAAVMEEPVFDMPLERSGKVKTDGDA